MVARMHESPLCNGVVFSTLHAISHTKFFEVWPGARGNLILLKDAIAVCVEFRQELAYFVLLDTFGLVGTWILRQSQLWTEHTYREYVCDRQQPEDTTHTCNAICLKKLSLTSTSLEAHQTFAEVYRE